MALLKTNYADGDGLTPGSTGGTTGINATNDRINTHTHDGTDTATLTRHPLIIASATGTTNLTGNGSAQNIFDDSFTTLSAGEYIEFSVFWDIPATITASVILSVGDLVISTVAHGGGAAPNHAFIEGTIIAKPSNQGDVAFSRVYVQGALETAPVLTTTMDKGIGGKTFDGITLTADPTIAQNPACYFNYKVVKYTMGI